MKELLRQTKRIYRGGQKKFMQASLSAYGFTLRHSEIIMLVVGVIVLVHGLQELAAAADGRGAAGGGNPSRNGSGAAGGGSRIGSSQAGGTPISGNAVQACSRNLGYLQGGFGTLVASGAGMGAIIAAALGGFKAAWSLFVVSIGTFVLRSYLNLFLTGC